MCVLLPKRKKKKKLHVTTDTCVLRGKDNRCLLLRATIERRREKKKRRNESLSFLLLLLALPIFRFLFYLRFFSFTSPSASDIAFEDYLLHPPGTFKRSRTHRGGRKSTKSCKGRRRNRRHSKVTIDCYFLCSWGERFNISSESRTRHDTQDNLRIWEVASPYSSF